MNGKQSFALPATLGDVRWLDAYWLLASCKKCGYEAIVDVEALPDFVPLVWFAEQFVCNRCDGIEAYILPSWDSELTKGPRLLSVYKTGPREIGPTE